MAERGIETDTPEAMVDVASGLARVIGTLAVLRSASEATDRGDRQIVADARTIVDACAASGLVFRR